MLRVVRHERVTTLAADVGCSHAPPLNVSAMLTEADGFLIRGAACLEG
jgi:hypothetical protein